MLGVQGGYWMPVTWLTHALDYHLGGLDPRVHHLSSLVFHGLNTLLVFFVSLEILRLAQKVPRPPSAPATHLRDIGAATLSALLFGIHPLHVETEPVHAINLGNTHLQKGLVADAIAEFQRAVELQPANSVAQRKLAEAYERLGKR